MTPKQLARYDELVNKEAFGSITEPELKELNDLQFSYEKRNVDKSCPQCAEKDAEIAKINGWREELRLKLRRVQNDYSVMESERNEAFKCLRIAREALKEYSECGYLAANTLEQIGEKE